MKTTKGLIIPEKIPLIPNNFKPQTVTVPDPPSVDIAVTEAQIKDAIDLMHQKNDFFAVVQGKTTYHMIIHDIKAISWLKIIEMIFTIIAKKL